MKNKIRITFLTQYFYPELISTGQLLTELAEYMTCKGIEVKVFTGQPTYYSTEKVKRKIDYRGIIIKRVFNTQLDKNTILGKVINSLSFFMSILLNQIFSRDKSPLLIVTNPPFLGIVGYICKKIKGRKYIYLIHDVYPDIAIVLGYLKKGSLIAKIWDKLNNKILYNAEYIIVIGRDMGKNIENKIYGKMYEKIAYIPNWSLKNEIVPIEKKDNPFVKEHGYTNKFVVQYSGNMGLFHDMETIIEAAEKLKDKDIYFLFIGGGGKKEKMIRMVKEYGLEKVNFLPYQDKNNIKYSLTCCDVSLVCLSKGVEGLAVPSKIYGMLAAGRPIIGILPQESEIASYIKEGDCGYIINPESADDLASKLLYLYNNQAVCGKKGENSRILFEKKFTLDIAAEKYIELFKKL